ncbi:6-bladed beta-propeller [Cytophagales bacterium EPR-FJ-38]
MDSIQINVPIEPHFVEQKPSNDKVLLFSRFNSTFYVIDKQGNALLELKRVGEGPGYYNSSVYQAGLHNEHLVIQDLKKIYTYDLEGQFVKDQSYRPTHYYTSGGNIGSGLKFLQDSLIIYRLGFTGVVTFNPNKVATIDTIKTVEIINANNGQIYDSLLAIRFEKESIYKQGLIYPTFRPSIELSTKNTLLIAYPNEELLYEYVITNNRLELKKKIEFKLDQFKSPRGLKEEDMIGPIDPNLNNNARLNSIIRTIFTTENDEVLILYTTGIPDKYASEEALGEYTKESKLLGGIIKDGKLISSGIEIPNNGFEYMNVQQIIYWGDNKWAFLQDNEIELDYYRLYIYELLPVN